MGKIMPLDLLSSIKGARSSEEVNELFRVIKRAVPGVRETEGFDTDVNTVSVEDLRNDIVEICADSEKEIIRKNFPNETNGFLVVPKVIED